jgi:hypothetical protein
MRGNAFDTLTTDNSPDFTDTLQGGEETGYAHGSFVKPQDAFAL